MPDRAPSAVVARLRAAGCVFAEEEAALIVASAGDREELDVMVERRVSGVPVEHVVGWAVFCGLRVVVEPGVFVPRRRTELMVAEATAAAEEMAVREGARATRLIVVDLCCGSGAIGLAIASAVGGVELHASDIDPTAVACARHNLEPVGGLVSQGDLYAALPPDLHGRVDLLLVNAPYVPTAALDMMPAEAREHEPLAALDGGDDGLDVQRAVIAGALEWLAPRGRLLVETSGRQAPATMRLMAGSGLAARIARCEPLDATVVIGNVRPASVVT